MRKCPLCEREYPDDAVQCIFDGESLIPELPVNEKEKKWIEESFQWLLETFGKDAFLKHKTILPEKTFFPDKYDGTEEAVDKVVSQICGYMDVNPNSIEVAFLVDGSRESGSDLIGEKSHSGAAGLYFPNAPEGARKKIALNVSAFKNPTILVATISHELGHVILLGGGKITRDRGDHEYLTDLLTVFLGLGIFTANSVIQFSQWQDYSRQGWSASRMGYLTEEMFGYSLAAYAWMRNEKKPAWSKYLCMDVEHYFKQSLRFFEEGGPTLLSKLTG
ncbi:MAG TPA: hypothetical protein VNU95_07745 [Candidatus Acidoferrales bacterium]|jgi:hypothetical protein|nr:hypothetical protein [Candidatus Acidoferrales bacterium]